MPEEQEPPSATGAVRALAHFINEPETDQLSNEQIHAQLSAAGVDLNRAKKRLESLIAETKGRALLNASRSKRTSFEARMAEFRSLFSDSHDLREQVRKLVQDVFGNSAQAAVAWRNFEHASDADLRSMLDDMTLLEELEKDEDVGSNG